MKLKGFIYVFFVLGIFFFPFNQYELIPALGEFKAESAILFFLPSFILIILYSIFNKRIYFPIRSKLYFIFIIFLFYCLLNFLINFNNISYYSFKGTLGVERFIKQFLSLLLSSVVFFQIYWFVLKDKSTKEILKIIRGIFFYSLIFVSFYAFIEILIAFFNFNFLISIFKFFDFFPFLEPKLHVGGRISSVTYEPPFLAIYLITIAGWMFSYIITCTNIYKKILPTVLVLILTFFSGSRTALIVITIQFLVFLYFLYFYYNYKKIILSFLKYCLIIFFTLGIFSGVKFYDAIHTKIESLDFIGNLKENVSNKSRLGIQYTSLVIFSENPFFGVGFGEQAFAARGRYPIWATNKNYEFDLYYKNKKVRSFPPGYNIYTRLLAELGIIGFSIFIYFQFSMLKQAKNIIKYRDSDISLMGVILFVTLLGLFINWMQIDSFRIYGVWISLAILIITLKTKNEQIGCADTTL